jgi:flagellar biosynthesis protein FlhG
MRTSMPERVVDQASGLRSMVKPRPTRAIAVTGGKGGVGKTNVSVNLGVAVAEMGRQVMLFDADLGLANIDVVLGLHPRYDLSDVMRGECSLADVLVEGPAGLKVIPGASGVQALSELSRAEHAGLIRAFSEVGSDTDLLIVDTAAGISDTVLSFARASHEIVVVVCDEPASITDAYAIIKLLNRDYGHRRFRILANMARSAQEGRELFNKMCRVTDRYLDVTLGFLGAIPFDDSLRKAVRAQRPVVQAFPRSRSAQAFRSLARKVDSWPPPDGANGQVQFFVERLIRYSGDFGEIAL